MLPAGEGISKLSRLKQSRAVLQEEKKSEKKEKKGRTSIGRTILGLGPQSKEIEKETRGSQGKETEKKKKNPPRQKVARSQLWRGWPS